MSTLTTNFSEHEVYSWADNVSSMTPSTRALAKELAKKEYDSNEDARYKALLIAQRLQTLRDLTNSLYPQYKGNIRLTVTSWLRPLEWEKLRDRSGASQHVQGHAVDFIIRVNGATAKQQQGMMTKLWNSIQGWSGGLAKKGPIGSMSFIHIDLGTRRRWEY